MIGAQCFRRNTFPRNNLQVYIARTHQRIGKESDKLRTTIKIAIITKKLHQTFTLFIQLSHIKVVSRTNDPLFIGITNQTVGTRTKSFVSHCIEQIGMSHINMVLQACCTGIIGTINPIGYFPIKKAIIMKQITCYLHTSFRINRRDIDRVGS